jgi:hypothetical protein
VKRASHQVAKISVHPVLNMEVVANGEARFVIHLCVSLLLPLCTSASAMDDKAARHLALRLYYGCLKESARVLSKTTNIIKPSVFEKVAATQCKEQEDEHRQRLYLESLSYLPPNEPLSKEEQARYRENAEQQATTIRRAEVIAYAEKFDKRHPGVRSCSLASARGKDERQKYLCAIEE